MSTINEHTVDKVFYQTLKWSLWPRQLFAISHAFWTFICYINYRMEIDYVNTRIVGPLLITDPPTTSSVTLSKKSDMWHMTCDMWHVTHDIWRITCETWWGLNILSKFQLLSSFGLAGKVIWRSGCVNYIHIINSTMPPKITCN